MNAFILFRTVAAAAALAVGLTACEIEVGDEEESSGGSVNTGGGSVNTGGGTGNNTDNNSGNNTGGGDDDDGGGSSVAAPAQPGALSPGNGEAFSGSGEQVTFVWTDAERAAEFELLVQGLGGGGWQTAVSRVTDGFQATYTLNNTAWTQYRWAVRSIGADGQTSAYTAWRSFSWTP